jgi:hypothetical protein
VFENQRDWPCRIKKSLGAAPRNLFSNRSKGFELTGFNKLSDNSIAFGAKRLRTYKFNTKLNAKFK